MSIITKGLGSNYLITKGYGSIIDIIIKHILDSGSGTETELSIIDSTLYLEILIYLQKITESNYGQKSTYQNNYIIRKLDN